MSDSDTGAPLQGDATWRNKWHDPSLLESVTVYCVSIMAIALRFPVIYKLENVDKHRYKVAEL